ncbi:hypothetical protein CDL12_15040 [Handroanthus impetiginosus]|uniref:Uncharacterized protein n=1 Tax=Handroanthus impetiginosus TaxID=429701 RepID=A0A2G9H4V4_9LAMI|nr:hypothetical protein CDL12_15040 [Handroanthus impetiginosus]
MQRGFKGIVTSGSWTRTKINSRKPQDFSQTTPTSNPPNSPVKISTEFPCFSPNIYYTIPDMPAPFFALWKL